MHKSKVLLLAVGFFALSVLGLWVTSKMTSFDWRETFSAVQFSWHHLIWVALITFTVYLADSSRYYFLARAVGTQPSFLTCLQSSTLNLLFGWITPAGALGAPAGAYVLFKRGIPADAAITIAFGRSSLFMMTSIFIALIVVACGFELPLQNSFMSRAVLGALVFLSLIAIFLPVLALLPYKNWAAKNPRSKLIPLLNAAGGVLERLSRILKHGKANFCLAVFASFVFNFAFVGLFMVFSRELVIADWAHTFATPLLFMSYNVVLPTPGGAGLAEISAPLFFKSPFTAQQAIAMALTSRLFTYALQILLGLFYLFFKLKDVAIVFLKPSPRKSAE